MLDFKGLRCFFNTLGQDELQSRFHKGCMNVFDLLSLVL